MVAPNYIPDALEPQVRKILTAHYASVGAERFAADLTAYFGSRAKAYDVCVELWPDLFVPKPEPVTPAPTPGSVVIPTRRMLIAGETREWWRHDPVVLCEAVFGLGKADAMCVELHGLEPSTIRTPANLYVWMEKQIEALLPLLVEIRRRGKLLWLYWFNSNIPAHIELSLDQHVRLLEKAERLWGGWQNIIVLGINETDAMPSGVLRGVMEYWARELPVDQTIGYERRGGEVGWAEYHPQGAARLPGVGSPSYRDVRASDHPYTLNDLFGGVDTDKEPNIPAVIRWMEQTYQAGFTTNLYKFGKVIHPEYYEMIGNTWNRVSGARNVIVQPSTGDAIDVSQAILLGPHRNVNLNRSPITRRLNSAQIVSGNVRLSYETLGWSTQSPIGANIDGRVVAYWRDGQTLFGGHFDWKRPGQTVKTLENLTGGIYLGRKVPSETDVYFGLVNNSGSERTNVVPGGRFA